MCCARSGGRRRHISIVCLSRSLCLFDIKRLPLLKLCSYLDPLRIIICRYDIRNSILEIAAANISISTSASVTNQALIAMLLFLVEDHCRWPYSLFLLGPENYCRQHYSLFLGPE